MHQMAETRHGSTLSSRNGVCPLTTQCRLERHGAIAGTASALMGSIQLVTGAALLAVAGLFAEGAPQPMVIGIAACGVAAFLVAQIALRRSVGVPASGGGAG